MALDFLAGCVGGCAGVVVGHPFDTIKVKLQTQDFKNPIYRGTFDCFKTVLKKESIGGLYRGMSSPMAGVSLVNAIVFGVYGNIQRRLSNPDSLTSHMLAGAAAGVMQSFICSPMELAKTRIQIQGEMLKGATNANTVQLYRNPLDCFKKTWKSHGLRGVFRGLFVTMLRETPGLALYFASYEYLTRIISARDPDNPIPTYYLMLAGGVSGTVSWIASFPCDVIKSRFQADGMNGVYKYKSATDCFRQSVKEEGYIFLTRGLNSTIVRSFPVNATTFTVVTWVFRLCGVQEESSPYETVSEALKEGANSYRAVFDLHKLEQELCKKIEMSRIATTIISPYENPYTIAKIFVTPGGHHFDMPTISTAEENDVSIDRRHLQSLDLIRPKSIAETKEGHEKQLSAPALQGIEPNSVKMIGEKVVGVIINPIQSESEHSDTPVSLVQSSVNGPENKQTVVHFSELTIANPR